MTCIVTLKNPQAGTVVMGCDSRVTLGNSMMVALPTDYTKVTEVSGFLLGISGAGRLHGVLTTLRIPFGAGGPSPDFNLQRELLSYMPTLRKSVESAGLMRTKDGVQDTDASVLVAFGNQICLINGDLTVTPIALPFWAIGSGGNLALGSLATSEKLGRKTAKDRVLMALKIAAQFNSAVGEPFVIKETHPLPKA